MKKFIIILSALFFSVSIQAQVPFWKQTSGPPAGTVSDITVDSMGRIIIWTRGSGVYRSEDNGNSWRLINTGLPNLNMYHGAASRDGYLYGVNSARDGQLFRYNENLFSPVWEEITPYMGIVGIGINDIAVDTNGDVYLALGPKGVMRSTDHGTTWPDTSLLVDTISISPNRDFDRNVAFLSLDGQGNLLAGMARGSLFLSRDKGKTWTKLETRNPDGSNTLATMVLSPNGNIIIGTQHQHVGSGGHIYVSTDNAHSWKQVYERPVNTEEQKDDIDKIIRVPGTNIFYANAHGITLRSVDFGQTWTIQDTEKRGDEVFSMASWGNNLFQICEPDGVFLSVDNGVHWIEKDSGIIAEFMWGIAINSRNELFGITEYGLWFSSDDGDHWEHKPEYGEDYSPSVFIDKKDNIFVGTSRGLWRSKDNGENLNHIIINESDNTNQNTINQVGDNFKGKLFCASNVDSIGFVFSTDEGDSWTRITNIPNQTKPVKAFAFSADSMLLACGSTGSTDYYLSEDDGLTWRFLSNNISMLATQLAIHRDGSYIARMLGPLGGIFRSTDVTHSWSKIFPPSDIGQFKDYYSMTIDSKGRIIVCTDSGIYRSIESSSSFQQWESISTGLSANDIPGKYIQCAGVVENSSTHAYFAASRGLGVYRSAKNYGGVHRTSASGLSIKIDCYPNPFSSQTNISFSLPARKDVALDLFDVLGRKVRSIFDGKLEAGENKFTFNGADLPNGSYLITLNIAGETSTAWITISK
jgi:photosystem II stability/assembly factor-like uncharacterized protein